MGRRRHTVALADAPAGPDLVQVGNCLLTKRCSTTKYETDGAEVVFCAFSLVAQHLDEDGRNESHLLDLEALNGGEEGFELKTGENDCFVAIVDAFNLVSQVRNEYEVR